MCCNVSGMVISWRSLPLQVRTYEGRLAELSAQLARAQRWGQEQLAALESREEEAVGMKVELASLREGYHSKAKQVRAEVIGPL